LIRNFLKKFYLVFIFILLYAPILTLIVFSFNASKTRAKWGGFTVKWYVSLFQNQQILQALSNTLVIALLSSLIATVIGTMAAIALSSMKPRIRTFWLSMVNIPMLNAEIVTGISLMMLFIAAGNLLSYVGGEVTFGFWTVLIGHITFNLPYVVLSVMPKLKQINISTYEAALDIGASPLYAFFRVVLPDIMPGVLSGFLLAFTLSLDDFIITHFVKGPGFDTLSTKIYTEVKKGIKPEMYALSTLIFVAVLLLLLIVNYKPKPKKK
jgi:spermidine/putrescine transport system permease protein